MKRFNEESIWKLQIDGISSYDFVSINHKIYGLILFQYEIIGNCWLDRVLFLENAYKTQIACFRLIPI